MEGLIAILLIGLITALPIVIFMRLFDSTEGNLGRFYGDSYWRKINGDQPEDRRD